MNPLSRAAQSSFQRAEEVSKPPADEKKVRDEAADSRYELQEVFSEFVGQTFFGTMLASMRKTVGKPAYMHGGRGEEVFQQQLDEQIVKELTESSASSVAQPMFELFQMQRRP
ncbi:MAG: rod-binding protein [Planctomycetota bacterium]